MVPALVALLLLTFVHTPQAAARTGAALQHDAKKAPAKRSSPKGRAIKAPRKKAGALGKAGGAAKRTVAKRDAKPVAKSTPAHSAVASPMAPMAHSDAAPIFAATPPVPAHGSAAAAPGQDAPVGVEQAAEAVAAVRAEHEGPQGGAIPATEPAGDGLPPDAPSRELHVDVDRWVLRDVLAHGPGQSVPLDERLRHRAQQPFTHEAEAWPQRLSQRRATQALAGGPQQRRDVQDAAVGFDIPLRNHPLVDLYIEYFTGRGRWFFARWLERSASLIPLMQEILTARGLPKDLVYLAMVESGFSPHAVSMAAASGYWQFIPSTGALFGLKQDRFVDERRDFVRATEAAGRFLHSLHAHFDGDWHLAWASYNAGEQRIRRAMAKTGAQTFWQLIERSHGLAKETVHYVPKIIAAAIVAKDAARYGFAVPAPAPLHYDQMTVDGALDVRLLAKHANIPIESLRALNPSLLYDVTPPKKRTRLRVPSGTLARSESALAALPSPKRLEYVAYRVQKGDTLSGIARRMNASVDHLRQFNRLLGPRLRIGQELMVPSALVGAVASKAARPKIGKATARGVALARLTGVGHRTPKARHVVASGDTLWSIARRYGVALETLGRHGAKATRLAVGDIVDIF